VKVNNRIEDIVKDIEKLRDKHAPDNAPDREKYDEVIEPDYIIKKNNGEKLVRRKCYHCNKESYMGKFQRWCSALCKYNATKDYDSFTQDDYKVSK